MKKQIIICFLLFGILESYGQSLITGQKKIKKNDDKRVFFYGATTLNTTSDLISSITGSQKFNTKFIIKPMTKKFGFDGWIGVNALNLKPTGVDKDSIDLVSLMFPETGNFGFVANPVLNFLIKGDDTNKFLLSAEGSIALRQSKVSNILTKDSLGNVTGSETINFSVINVNVMPIKFTYRYEKEDDFTGAISVGFYYNLFNIPNEDAQNFNKLFPADKPLFINGKRSSIHSFGAKFIVSLNDFMFYTDLRYNSTSTNIADSNPLKGFVFNAGFATDIQIFSK